MCQAPQNSPTKSAAPSPFRSRGGRRSERLRSLPEVTQHQGLGWNSTSSPRVSAPLSRLRHRHKQEPGEDHRNWGQGPWGSTTCQLSHGCPREPWSPSKMEGMHTMGEGPGAWPTPQLRPSGAGAWHTPQTRCGVPGRAAPRPFRGCERQEAGSCLHLRTLVPSPVWWPETDTGNAGRRVKGALASA